MPRSSPFAHSVETLLRKATGVTQLFPGTDAQADRSTAVAPGLNFAAQDYLGLAAHPALRGAAIAALGQHRLVASGPTVPTISLTLEDRIARFLALPAAVTFPSGAEAIRATLHMLLRPGDDIIVDTGAHPAMMETVLTTRARLHRCPAGSVDAVERRLRRLTRQHRRGRLYVAVPSIAALTSVIADLAELTSICAAYAAALIVDVSHDVGCIAQGGRGVMEVQGSLSQVDVVLGSFAKSFGAPGGFVACRDPALRDLIRQSGPGQRRTSPLSPVFAAAILAALDIVDSAEGRRRRRRLHGNSLRLRNHLMADGLRVLGQPSPLVPVLLPPITALPRTVLLHSAGPVVPLLQAPLVAGRTPRWRIQLSADHSPADIDDLAELIRDVTRAFDRPARTLRQVETLPQP